MNCENNEVSLERARQYVAARRLKEDVAHLRVRWKHYNFPVQELLKLLLRNHGLDATTIATDALDRQFSTRGVTPTFTKSKRGILFYERCIEACLV